MNAKKTDKTKKRLVLIGNGMAGMKAVEEILSIAPDAFSITVFGAEQHPNYNRVLLSRVLSGEMTAKDITLNSEDWYRVHGITLHLGAKVEAINRGSRKVTCRGGAQATGYDNLIIATGARPLVPPIPGVDMEGVVTFRDVADCERMKDAASRNERAAVIGGGLLGLEAAKGLLSLGMDVTVVHDRATLMQNQLDKTAGDMLEKALSAQGMKFRLSTLTSEIFGDERVRGLRFKDGDELECGLVVMAAGIRPNKELAEASNLYCNRGIIVNDYMQTFTDPAVYAVGECVEHRGRTYGLIAPLFEQARILAYHITGCGVKTYRGSAVSAKLKVSGVDVFSAGDFTGEAVRAGLAVPDGGQTDTIEYTDRKSGVYKKLVIKNDVISGAILFGDTAGASRFFQMMQDEVNISAERHSILFGNPNLGNAGHSGLSEVSMMSPSTIVCGCNGVTKKTITDAIVEKRLTTLRDITKCTKAAGSCGGCAPIVEEILVSVLGAPFTSPAKAKPLCDCTELTHEDVKKEIRTSRLTTVGTAMRVMGWETEGCETCRPAVNYYIQTAWPAQAVDDPFSRVENERLCANIQEDSTYSVIPRMYGGLTTPDELMKIAGAAKKYNVPAVKITGGQRIALVGVKKEDLPEVWGQLDMPSGYAYGKALRTVKTCVGRRWCRFGTQDSLSLGITIEKTLERIWTPAKVKLSVSGCPRNCAESSIKDLGIVGIEGAWEIYCGGNGGVKVRTADLLAAVSEKEEVMEIVKAYLQLYREDARYGERTSSWIKRVGLQGIKKAVIEDLKSRRLLAGRMDEYLSTLREDPWEGLLKRPSTPAPL